MGYRREPKIYTLVFDDPELEGLEIKARSLPIGELRKFMGFKEGQASTVEQTEELFAAFAKCLISWNLEDEDGTPVPPTMGGIDDQDQDFILPIIQTWVTAVSGVDDELGKDSPSGKPYPVGSIPMEPLSPSLAS